MGRILSIDFGSRRMGLAISDESKRVALPRPYVAADRREEIALIAERDDVEEILLGLPVGLSGQETKMTQEVKKFKQWLEGRLAVPIRLIDERFSTEEARRFTGDRGLIDSMSAQKMLERHLESVNRKES